MGGAQEMEQRGGAEEVEVAGERARSARGLRDGRQRHPSQSRAIRWQGLLVDPRQVRRPPLPADDPVMDRQDHQERDEEGRRSRSTT